MSALAGRFGFAAGEESARVDRALRDSLLALGPGHTTACHDHTAALYHHAFSNDPEGPVASALPVASHDRVPDSVSVTWDGRLDNRNDLLRQLHLPGDASDAVIVQVAYRRWHENAFQRLLGDWSVVLFDGRSQQLLLVSDFLGTRPLYYVTTNQGVLWHSSPFFLATLVRGQRDLDTNYLLSYLGFGVPATASVYRNVSCVPPAHVVTFLPDRSMTSRAHWGWQRVYISYARLDNYDEQFRELFFDAVRVRLRSRRPVWSQLSGGMDSTAIVCAAAHLMRRGLCDASQLRTITYTSSKSPESDESRYAEAVRRFVRLPNATVDDEELSPLPAMLPDSPLGLPRLLWLTHALMDIDGASTLLTGRLGDLVMGNYPDYTISLADYLYRGEWRAWSRQALAWGHESRIPMIKVAASSIRPLLPATVQAALARRDRLHKLRAVGGHTLASLFSIAPEHARTFQDVRSETDAYAANVARPGNRRLLATLWRYTTSRRLQAPVGRFSYGHPYTHRPLLEFILAIPGDILSAPGRPRALMRRALADIIPPEVLARVSKGYVAPSLLRQWQPVARRLLQDARPMRVLERGLVDETSARRRLQELAAGRCHQLGNLHLIVTLEYWLREHEVWTGSVGPSAGPADIRVPAPIDMTKALQSTP